MKHSFLQVNSICKEHLIKFTLYISSPYKLLDSPQQNYLTAQVNTIKCAMCDHMLYIGEGCNTVLFGCFSRSINKIQLVQHSSNTEFLSKKSEHISRYLDYNHPMYIQWKFLVFFKKYHKVQNCTK